MISPIKHIKHVGDTDLRRILVPSQELTKKLERAPVLARSTWADSDYHAEARLAYPPVALRDQPLLDRLGEAAQFGVETVAADVPDNLASDPCHYDDSFRCAYGSLRGLPLIAGQRCLLPSRKTPN